MKKFFYYLTLLSSLIAFVIGCSKEEEELPKLELNATELSFKSEGGDELVGVTSNTNWSAVSSEKWCEVSPSSSNGNGAIKVTAQKNEKSESRTAKISVVSGSLTRIVVVSQAGASSENGSGGSNEEGGNGSGNENGGTVNGKLPGKFSVSATKQVSFSMGNLQYQASTKTWRFAENQYDVIGVNNKNISSTYSGWIDLFGWGTSGYNGKYPYMTSTNDSDYGDGYNDISGTNYDWGVHNAISNGGGKAGMWRTLTANEWYYIFNIRTNAENLRGQATVNGQTGNLLLPDGWSAPSGLTFTAGDFTTNSYSAPEWNKMEAAGAVFLPCAGYRYGTDVSVVGSDGRYWSSTAGDDRDAYGFFFYSGNDAAGVSCRFFGHSVRLATE